MFFTNKSVYTRLSPVDGKNPFFTTGNTHLPAHNVPVSDFICDVNNLPKSHLVDSVDAMRATLDDFSMLPPPREVSLPPLNNNNVDCRSQDNLVDSLGICRSPQGTVDCHTVSQSRLANCHTPPMNICHPTSSLANCHTPPLANCHTPVSILSHFDDSKPPDHSFPNEPQYISL